MDQAARDALRALAGIKPAPKGAPGVLKSVFEGFEKPLDKNALRTMAGITTVKEDTTGPAIVQPVVPVPAPPLTQGGPVQAAETDLDKIEKLLHEAIALLNNVKKAK